MVWRWERAFWRWAIELGVALLEEDPWLRKRDMPSGGREESFSRMESWLRKVVGVCVPGVAVAEMEES